jgi:cobalt/nickel transport system permease protein
MHVPDGIVPFWLQIALLAVTGVALFVAYRKVRMQFDDRLVPFMGVLAAVIFAAQLVNFPIPPFSSGHLVGSTLLAVMVSPWVAMIIMALVLLVQALFGDGGILTYGLNAFNMAIFSVIVGYGLAVLLYRSLNKHTSKNRSVLISTGLAAFVTTVLAAVVLGLELFTVPGFSFEALLAIIWVHVIIAVGEGILTAVILGYFVKANPRLVLLLKEDEEKPEEEPTEEEQKSWLLRQTAPVLVTSIALVAFLILAGLASGNPDGFEWALFIFAGVPEPEGAFGGIFAFLQESPIVDFLTGFVGIIAVLGLGVLLFRFATRKKA